MYRNRIGLALALLLVTVSIPSKAMEEDDDPYQVALTVNHDVEKDRPVEMDEKESRLEKRVTKVERDLCVERIAFPVGLLVLASIMLNYVLTHSSDCKC